MVRPIRADPLLLRAVLAVALAIPACASTPAFPESPWDGFAANDFAAVGVQNAWNSEQGLLLEYRVVIDTELPDHIVPALVPWEEADRAGEESRRATPVAIDASRWEELVAQATPVKVLTAFHWVELRGRLLEAFAPGDPMQATVLQLSDQEWTVFRDESGELQDALAGDRPRGLRIESSLSELETRERVLDTTRDYLEERFDSHAEVVFTTGAVSSEASSVYFDVDRALIIIHDARAPAVGNSFVRTVDRTGTVGKRVLGGVLDIIQRPVTNVNRLVHAVGHGAYDTVKASNWTPRHAELPPLYEGPGMDLEVFEQELDGITATQRHLGRVDLLVDGKEYFPRLIQAITDADRTVDVRMFIFKTDDFGITVADHLKRRTDELEVRVLLDGVGTLMGSPDHSQGLPPDFVPPVSIARYLERDSGVRVRVATPAFFRADHTKTITIDRALTFLGGMNIGREYRFDWHDLMVQVTGPVVDEIDLQFRAAWVHAAWWGDFGYVFWRLFRGRQETPPGADDHPIRVLRTRIDSSEIYRAQLHAIRSARRRILIQNSYFSDNETLTALVNARQRGVDVRVILPVHGNHAIMNASNMVTTNVMLANGIRVYLYPGMTHVKAAVYDGWACLGSANFDRLSLRRNAELNIAFSDDRAVHELLEEVFEPDMAVSLEVTEPFSVGFSERLQEFLANAL